MSNDIHQQLISSTDFSRLVNKANDKLEIAWLLTGSSEWALAEYIHRG